MHLNVTKSGGETPFPYLSVRQRRRCIVKHPGATHVEHWPRGLPHVATITWVACSNGSSIRQFLCTFVPSLSWQMIEGLIFNETLKHRCFKTRKGDRFRTCDEAVCLASAHVAGLAQPGCLSKSIGGVAIAFGRRVDPIADAQELLCKNKHSSFSNFPSRSSRACLGKPSGTFIAETLGKRKRKCFRFTPGQVRRKVAPV